ncbi:MAG: 50S ribosomal protein L5 [bacterium]|nr:50S ribosomal protein L5 [bacterium]
MTEVRLKNRYFDEIVPRMMEQFGYTNVNQVPRLSKVAVNQGLGQEHDNMKVFDSSVEELALITGQHPVITRAKRSVANFKIREGQPVGVRVTLRRDRMYEFVDRFISFALPRIRDFRGVNPNGFDGRGNFTMGITEQIIFPEIDYDNIVKINGMNLTIVTTAKTDEEARALLGFFGMPFAETTSN